MGFLGNDNPTIPKVDPQAAFQMLVAGDLVGAWCFLQSADDASAPDVLHNKALCLRAAGRRDEALQFSRQAFRRLTEGVPQRPFDPVGTELIRLKSGPGPMNPVIPGCNPTYAGLQARWLYCLCLSDCGEEQECVRISAPLEQLGLKLFEVKE